jgi:xylulose-5-phosphate/fructose-6-phosphate phosphoketolase
VVSENANHRNFRIFGPDELVSNRLDSVFESTARQWVGNVAPADEHLAPSGAVLDSILSEHTVEGWLEGYLLTGRHGILNSYEAFIRIIDSMVSQHAKWIKMCSELPWRRDISSLNFLLTSHVWRQDHNGFTHQDPGFIDHLVNKKPESVRVYLPPDANCLLSVVDHCLKSRNYINVVVSGKHPSPQWLSVEEAVVHTNYGAGVWQWASNDSDNPDVILACAGDVPTLEMLAATSILRTYLPSLKIRFVNVVDLMRLQPDSEHPHGMNDIEYNKLFTENTPIIFAYHGYPWLIHRLVYRRKNQHIHVRGYTEEGTITTAFDMTVLNKLDRFHLVMDVIQRLGLQSPDAMKLYERMEKKLIEHRNYIVEHGVDMPEVRNWEWENYAQKPAL